MVAVLTSMDKISLSLIKQLFSEMQDTSNIVLIIDKSSSLKRLIKLIVHKRISVLWLIKMMIAHFRQQLFLQKTLAPHNLPDNIRLEAVSNNQDLKKILLDYPDIKKIICFRAGLIINSKNINMVEFLNIHCAKIPEYGGLMAVSRALNNHDYEQECVLHKVITTIDGGEVLKTQPYTLNPNLPYWKNELTAYQTGIVLLKSVLESQEF